MLDVHSPSQTITCPAGITDAPSLNHGSVTTLTLTTTMMEESPPSSVRSKSGIDRLESCGSSVETVLLLGAWILVLGAW